MAQNENRRRRRRKKNNAALLRAAVCLTLVLVGLLVVSTQLGTQNPEPTKPSLSIPQSTTAPSATENPTQPPVTTVPPTTAPTEPPIVKESSMTISAVGDVLMHKPVINTGDQWDGTYNFDSIFTYFSDYVMDASYAIGNLETTLAGNTNGYDYNGYPNFNCPDDIIRSMKTAGFDLVLTANNHTYDTRTIGLMRTQQVIQDQGLEHLGTKTSAEDPNYFIAEKDGIRVGICCYTYETDGVADQKALNGIGINKADIPLINSFDYQHMDLFYSELSENMATMRELGADAVIVFMHWGEEYQLKQNSSQSAIAQKMCDLGVDVIIGGHPHVVQPVELLTSSVNPEQKTVCLYSMGNAVSNQRLGNLSNVSTAHTEDGVCFSVTFSRYSDGTVILESAQCLPTWVDLRTLPTGRNAYCILPLDTQIPDWQAAFDLTDTTARKARESYDRTWQIVGDGITQVNEYLTQHTLDVEAQIGVQ